MPHVSLKERFKKLNIEVELGFTRRAGRAGGAALPQLRRADGVRGQAVHRVRRLHRHLPGRLPDHHAERRRRPICARACKAPAKNLTQPLYVSAALPQTGRVMVKDEDLCVHCGLCAERCPTAAWDMQKSTIHWPHAGDEAVRSRRRSPRSPERMTSQRQNMHHATPPRQRFRHQDRDRQRHRLGQRQHAADEVDLPQRHPGDGQELLPLQHPGAAHLVRDPRDPRRLRRPLRPGRHHGRDECRDLRARRARK